MTQNCLKSRHYQELFLKHRAWASLNADVSTYITKILVLLKETKSATMNIFRFFIYFLFKSFVKVELSYVFKINLFTIAEKCTEK